MIEPSKLKPFKRFCMTIGELPTTYMESMTYYEMLEWLCKYILDNVIPAVNTNSEAIEELQEDYKNITEYITENIEQIASQILTEKIENGELIVSLGIDYNEETEALTFSIESDTPSEIIEELSTLTTPESEE